MARKKMHTKKQNEAKAKVNPKLEGFEVKIDRFGEITSSFEIDKINKFLDEEVEDKKLVYSKKPRKKK